MSQLVMNGDEDGYDYPLNTHAFRNNSKLYYDVVTNTSKWIWNYNYVTSSFGSNKLRICVVIFLVVLLLFSAVVMIMSGRKLGFGSSGKIKPVILVANKTADDSSALGCQTPYMGWTKGGYTNSKSQSSSTSAWSWKYFDGNLGPLSIRTTSQRFGEIALLTKQESIKIKINVDVSFYQAGEKGNHYEIALNTCGDEGQLCKSCKRFICGDVQDTRNNFTSCKTGSGYGKSKWISAVSDCTVSKEIFIYVNVHGDKCVYLNQTFLTVSLV